MFSRTTEPERSLSPRETAGLSLLGVFFERAYISPGCGRVLQSAAGEEV